MITEERKSTLSQIAKNYFLHMEVVADGVDKLKLKNYTLLEYLKGFSRFTAEELEYSYNEGMKYFQEKYGWMIK